MDRPPDGDGALHPLLSVNNYVKPLDDLRRRI
jgi:hypothetical protein